MKLREWPLVLFTVLGQAAVGTAMFLILPLYIFPNWTYIRSMDGLRLTAPLAIIVLLGAAVLFSLLHLGNPGRAYRALAKSGSSWLSREILAELIFGAAAAALAVLAWKMPRSAAGLTLSVLVVAEAGAFVYSMARIYTIAAVPLWFSPATPVAFVSTSLVLGSLVGAVLSGMAGAPLEPDQARFHAGLTTAALIALGAAFMIAVLYAPRFGIWAKRESFPVVAPARGLAVVHAFRLILLAAALGLAIPAVSTPSSDPWIAASLAVAFVSEVLGRFVFYSLPAGL
jgi:anaerobic dimethyl sulfoxide reductase subunit C (anchor subunit)